MRKVMGAVLVAVLGTTGGVAAQTTAAERDPVLRAIWTEGMDSSQTRRLAQTLIDSIGPRLTGSPGIRAGNEWLVRTYRGWGVEARNERYGTWWGWRRGITHVDLLQPWVRSLEAIMLAGSPGTRGAVRATTVTLPQGGSAAALEEWLPQVRGKLVLASLPQPTCRPDQSLERWATPESLARLRQERDEAQRAWQARLEGLGVTAATLLRRLESAGAAGILVNRWSNGWGVDKIFSARTQRTPVVNLSCEDYGLVYRLTENRQGPLLRLEAESEDLGEVPVFNTIAEIRGVEKPDEYVVLSAHFDSWDGATGATDNGTGTVTMLEAVRILSKVYPRPRRTILVGHWGGEEQGLNGSRAFTEDHPEVVRGLQALFNQDNGTGRVVNIAMQGFAEADRHFNRWLERIPAEITRHITLTAPGQPGSGGSDYASFVCHGAPAFGLSSLGWDYGIYTWHTNRDTFDKISFDDLKNNATLTAMLAYLASEDPERVSRVRIAELGVDRATGQPAQWPSCRPAARSSVGALR